MTKPFHLLVFRFSALGDVAMTVPIIKLALQQYPNLHITFVSTAFVAPLFSNIDRLQFFAADLKGTHKGVGGLYRLHKEIKDLQSFDAIADLHNVLRTKLLRAFLSLSTKKIAVLNKGRKEKRELTRIKDKKLRPLKSTFSRYADVFAALGFKIVLETEQPVLGLPVANELQQLKREGFHIVGLAPFAKHAEKTYPIEKMKEGVRMLAADQKIKLFLFGGKEEAAILQQWVLEFPTTQSLAGTMPLVEELQWIAGLDLMISMDSANMHLASLFDIPVISVWGATHPFAGFYGWTQKEETIIQTDLYCRPCSVFGNRPCYRGDLACMHSIAPETIVKKVKTKLER